MDSMITIRQDGQAHREGAAPVPVRKGERFAVLGTSMYGLWLDLAEGRGWIAYKHTVELV